MDEPLEGGGVGGCDCTDGMEEISAAEAAVSSIGEVLREGGHGEVVATGPCFVAASGADGCKGGIF